MNFIRNRNFRAGPQTSLEGFICPKNSDKQQTIKVFGRSDGGVIFERKYSTFNLSKEEKSYMKSVCDKGIGYLQSENYSQFTDSL